MDIRPAFQRIWVNILNAHAVGLLTAHIVKERNGNHGCRYS
jgi:hypothetical protein